MKIILSLRYDAKLLDARLIQASARRHQTPTVDVDLTEIIDKIVHHSIKQIAADAAAAKNAGVDPVTTAAVTNGQSKKETNP